MFAGTVLQLLVIIFGLGYTAQAVVKNSDNYGPYTVNTDYFEYCAGPKSKNLTLYEVKLMKEGANCILKVNLTFLVRTGIDEIKLTVYTLNEHKPKGVLLSYKLSDPCHHFAIASLLEKYLSATKCLINKGTYDIIVNISETAKMFFGTSFFYGKYLIKSIAVTKQGNIICFKHTMIVTKNI